MLFLVFCVVIHFILFFCHHNRLEDLVSQDDIIHSITSLIDSDNLPHLLLYGPPGTGKTSTIVAAAKRMYGNTKYNSMTLELNASDARGIDVVRNEIKEFAGTQQLFTAMNGQGNKKGNVKLIILDEADAMTSDAQFALRRIIEKYTKNARFCLICNYVSKIIPALQSRCTRFRFAPLSKHQIQGRLEYVAQQEHIALTADGIQAILDLSGGDMRRVLNLLQSTAMSKTKLPSLLVGEDTNNSDENPPADSDTVVVNENDVYLTSGAPLPTDMDDILLWLLNETFRTACQNITQLCTTKGYALADVLQQLTMKIMNLQLDSEPLARLLDGMSQVECRLANSASSEETIQTASLVGVFVETRQLLEMKS